MRLVETSKGLLPYSDLEVRDVITETDNSRCIATEFYYSGELVRRDAAVSILRGLSTELTPGEVG